MIADSYAVVTITRRESLDREFFLYEMCEKTFLDKIQFAW